MESLKSGGKKLECLNFPFHARGRGNFSSFWKPSFLEFRFSSSTSIPPNGIACERTLGKLTQLSGAQRGRKYLLFDSGNESNLKRGIDFVREEAEISSLFVSARKCSCNLPVRFQFPKLCKLKSLERIAKLSLYSLHKYP